MERNSNETTADQESTDSKFGGRREAFETDVKRYQTAAGNVLLAEPGKGAAWIEADPDDVLDTGEWL